MLSQALKNGVSSSSITSLTLASSHLSSPSLLADLECSLDTAQMHVSVEEDADSPKFAKERASQHGEEEAEDAEPFWGHGEQSDPQSPFLSGSDSIDALCRSFVANSLSHKPSLAHTTSIGGIEISGASNSTSSNPSPFAGVGMVARSCPKPIVMPRRSRQGSLANHDELSVFVPPHEMAASSLLDPTNVSDSLCRKGSAAIRLRSGVLRRTGFLEGHTETLKPQTSVTSFRQ